MRRLLALLLALSAPLAASGVTLSEVSTSAPFPGITLTEYRASSPSTDVFVAEVDLCAEGVHVTATRAPSSLQTAGSWAGGVGAVLAVNGDFYLTSPVRVYGRVVSDGIPWPEVQTGVDPAYASEWYYERFGWIALGHDRVEFTHSEWVKNNATTLGIADGWDNATVAAAPPVDTLALVSGFPEIVIEGTPITCPSPTDSSCFPDRSDMRARHPRTAMGITADRTTLLFAVVDGRTSRNTGMYGAELADLMGKLGAYEAFNLDGGGSSQMWVSGQGYVNDTVGNNNGSSTRSVANHWGVYAGAVDGWPSRPSHCETEPSCGVIPPAGAILDDDSACFRTFGPRQYWREESVGYGGHLYWTNAWNNDPLNWAWWQLDFAEEGDYLVEYYAEDAFAVYDSVPYLVVADGVETRLQEDQGAASGWTSLGTYHFAAGGSQLVSQYDGSPVAVPSNQHIVADALRVTRVGPYCGDGTCDDGEPCACEADCPVVAEIPDNGIDDDCDGTVDGQPDGTDTGPDDTQDTDDGGGSGDGDCGCATGGRGAGAALAWLAAALLTGRRRRR